MEENFDDDLLEPTGIRPRRATVKEEQMLDHVFSFNENERRASVVINKQQRPIPVT